MSTPTIERSGQQESADGAVDADPLDVTFIENTSATETVLMCSTGDTCGSSCPSACTTSRLPFQPGCVECERWRAAEASARAELDHSRAVDCRVLARQHLRTVHGVKVVR